MSTDTCLGLLLDAPLQSWGHSSRFERRTTALHPTRSAILGLIAASLGIDKHADDEAVQLSRLNPLRLTTVTLPRRNSRGRELPVRRLEDYHTVTGIRRASGKVASGATVQTYRQYLLDARFAALIDGPSDLLNEIASALRDPRWGVWFGRKSCLPASPILVAQPGPRDAAWVALLLRAGYTGDESLESFDRVIESSTDCAGADMIEDTPIGYGLPIGQRHRPRWILRQPRSTGISPKS